MASGATLGGYRLGADEVQLRHELLVRYYEAHRDAVEPLLDCHVAQGHRIAIWCGGKSGGQPETAFTQVFDPDATKIACLCRAKLRNIASPQDKYPMVRHAEAGADVVLYLAKNPYRAVGAFAKEGLHPEHVIVEAEIWGHVARHAGHVRPGAARPVGPAPRMCSLTVLFKPDDSVLDAFASYAGKVEKAYVYDNSPALDEALKRGMEALGNVEYLFGGGVNRGICAPVNLVARMARAQGFDWLVTFDQDSAADEGMVEEMARFAGSRECPADVALISPLVTKGRKPVDLDPAYPAVSYAHMAIQSGLAHRLSAMETVGDYDERLFIDEVENDYCARVRVAGFHIVRLGKAVLLHQVNDAPKGFVNKYSPMRFYHRTRNMLYMLDNWRDRDPKYAANCARGLGNLIDLIGADEHPGDKALAMMLGYLHHRQGRWLAYEEALRELDRT